MLIKFQDTVTFIFDPGGADFRQVALAGSFNGWSKSANPMQRDPDGTYRTTLALQPGEHRFCYCADGRWHGDLSADKDLMNGNGIIGVPEPPTAAAPPGGDGKPVGQPCAAGIPMGEF